MHFCVSLLICLFGKVFVQEILLGRKYDWNVRKTPTLNVNVISSFIIICYAALYFSLRSIIVNKITVKNSFSVITVDLVD